jgi:hypothetical protein
MADRYLTRDALDRALAAGRDVEQWLGPRKEGDLTLLRWLTIEHEADGTATLRVSDVFDEGDPDFLNVYEFAPYDPEDAQFGVTKTFLNAYDALAYAVDRLGADPQRFVNQGFVYLDYEDYLKTRV